MAVTSPFPIPVVDLFAGPGGLGEGFSSFRDAQDRRCFKVVLSVEKDPVAHATLRIRSFFRQFEKDQIPEQYYEFLRGLISREDLFARYPEAAECAESEARQAVLGGVSQDTVDAWISDGLRGATTWVLVGGPPCQAYSVAGRSRRRGVKNYREEDDERHFLYREYLRIIANHWPAVFVFENVKGLLSARLNGASVFDRILKDLQAPADAIGVHSSCNQYGYRVWPLVDRGGGASSVVSPLDFVVKAEKHGIPQARHRVLLVGVRSDITDGRPDGIQQQTQVSSWEVLQGIPPIRSLLPRPIDSGAAWIAAIRNAEAFAADVELAAGTKVAELFVDSLRNIEVPAADRGGRHIPGNVTCGWKPDWFLDERIGGVCNHEGRNHIEEDLYRYLFAACYSRVNNRAAKLRDFPSVLLPRHRNVKQALLGGNFQDRFRVQIEDRPATTITSHMAKDGHHFIHPDERQCRTLTPREAARLQTFPDNYFFCGPRTSQYIQIGNAVPPLLASQIAGVVYSTIAKRPEKAV